MLPTRFASESSNKDVSTGTFFRSGIIRIQGVLVIHRRVLVTSIKTNSLSCFFLFIFKSGQSCNALRGGDIIYVIGAIKNCTKTWAGKWCEFSNTKRAAITTGLIRSTRRFCQITPWWIIFITWTCQTRGVKIADSKAFDGVGIHVF